MVHNVRSRAFKSKETTFARGGVAVRAGGGQGEGHAGRGWDKRSPRVWTRATINILIYFKLQ